MVIQHIERQNTYRRKEWEGGRYQGREERRVTRGCDTYFAVVVFLPRERAATLHFCSSLSGFLFLSEWRYKCLIHSHIYLFTCSSLSSIHLLLSLHSEFFLSFDSPASVGSIRYVQWYVLLQGSQLMFHLS